MQVCVDCVPVKQPESILNSIESSSKFLIRIMETNPDLYRGSFFRIFSKEHKKIGHKKMTKIARTKKLFRFLEQRIDDITKTSERCLFKCFLSFMLKGIIWELEFRKLGTSKGYLGEEKLRHSIYEHLELFTIFFENYNYENPKDLIGIPFSDFEKIFDEEISNDLSYYTLIKKQKTCLSTKIAILYYCNLYDDKDILASSLHKTVKSITSMENKICDDIGFLDLEKILDERKLEMNRIFCDNVDLHEVKRLMDVYIARTDLNKIPRDEPEYKKAKRSIKRSFPNFAFT